MIVILGYCNDQDNNINNVLEKLAIPFEYSLSEAHITRADQVILPNATNLVSAFRKLNVMNLFSFLRLINKPILGINTGFQLMCHNFSKEKCGLGFFDVKLIDRVDNNFPEVNGILEVSDESRLLSPSMNNQPIIINTKMSIDSCNLTRAWAIIGSKKNSISLEKNNHFGLLLAEEKNEEIFFDTINNFSKFI